MDNLTSIEQQILNLDCEFRCEFIDRNSPLFWIHLEEVGKYEGRYQENYDIDTMRNRIVRENRFNIGGLKIWVNGALSRSLLLEDFKGWVFLSRLISYNHPRMPLLTVGANDWLVDYASKHNKNGIFAGVNERNRMYANCVDTKKFRLFNDDAIPLFAKHLEIISGISKLPEPRLFQRNNQWILYKEMGGSIKDLFNE